jgi:hypothetical protein
MYSLQKLKKDVIHHVRLYVNYVDIGSIVSVADVVGGNGVPV